VQGAFVLSNSNITNISEIKSSTSTTLIWQGNNTSAGYQQNNLNIQPYTGSLGVHISNQDGSTILYAKSSTTDSAVGVGTTNPLAKFHVTGSRTAASALAQGVFFNNTLVAAANNDVLVGLDINPTFTNGAFTGVTNTALRVTGNVSISGALIMSSAGDISAKIIKSVNASNTYINLNGTTDLQFNVHSSATNGFRYSVTGGNEIMRLFASGNLVLQNGGTFTDAGYKLDVNGTARVQGAFTATLANVSTANVVYYNSSTGLMTYATAPIGAQFVIDYDYNIVGLKNGSNVLFTTSATFIVNTTRVFLNGQRLTRGAGYDYIETGTNQITFTNPPVSTDLIIIEYQI
jgi:hypothetical protein